VKYLNSKNYDIKIAHQRGKIFRILPIYKKVSLEEMGKLGPFYNLFVVSFVLFIICFTIGIILLLVT
jgi:hypothetical protein